MAGSVNKVILIGNLGADPETRKLESGVTLTRINIATSESYTDKTSGERKENTEWHRVVLWRKLGEIAEQYLKKGHKVYIEGKLRTRSWEDDQKITRYSTEIIADHMTMLNKPEGTPQNNSGGYGQPESSSSSKTAQQPSKAEEDFTNDEDDDLPF